MTSTISSRSFFKEYGIISFFEECPKALPTFANSEFSPLALGPNRTGEFAFVDEKPEADYCRGTISLHRREIGFLANGKIVSGASANWETSESAQAANIRSLSAITEPAAITVYLVMVDYTLPITAILFDESNDGIFMRKPGVAVANGGVCNDTLRKLKCMCRGRL